MHEVLKYGNLEVTPLYCGMKAETYDYCKSHPEVLRYALTHFDTRREAADYLPAAGSTTGTSDGLSSSSGRGGSMLTPQQVEQIVDAIGQLDWVQWVKQQMQGQFAGGQDPDQGPEGPPVQKYEPAFPGSRSMGPPSLAPAARRVPQSSRQRRALAYAKVNHVSYEEALNQV